jgi:AcrR family transcriptional regulator
MPTTPPSSSVPGLRERKKARTKATVQREALRLFSRQGYAATSVEQIAAAAEISPSTFFRYFPTKEDVVLADFMDARTVAHVVTAPAQLGPLAALRHALTVVIAAMTTEELELETLRNGLIRSEPELRRGLVAELVRPARLFADALAERLGRDRDDPDLLVFAAAAIGGMVLGTGPEALDGPIHPDPRTVLPAVLERFERLEQMLVLPPEPSDQDSAPPPS